MADLADTASEYTERFIEESKSQIKRYEGESARECKECEAPIPEARREAVPGTEKCVYCAELDE